VSNPYFPFHHLGFQCNPFRAVIDAEWIELAILPDFIPTDFIHLQILGDKGRGKTTALLKLSSLFDQAAYEHLEVDQDRFITRLDGLSIFLLDEAQRLNARERERLFSKIKDTGLRVVLGSHEDYSPRFAKHGWPLTTVRLETVPRAHVAAVIRRRLNYFALRSEQPALDLTPAAIAYLHQQYGADLRLIENVLYEVFEQLKGMGSITAIDEALIRGLPGG
jgi:hypothetical protein